MSNMESFRSRVQDVIHTCVADREYHDVTDGFTIKRDDGVPTVSTTLVVEEPGPLGGTQGNDSAGVDVSDWKSCYEDLSIPLDGEVAATANKYLSTIGASAEFTDTTAKRTTHDPLLLCVDPDKGVSAVIDFTLEWPVDEDVLADIATVLTEDEGVECSEADPADIVAVSVRSPLFDPNDDEMGMPTSPDYSITVETDAPHELLGRYESLGEYAETYARNNEGYTKADVLSWDTYRTGFEAWGFVEANEVVRCHTNRFFDGAVSVSNPDVHRSVTEFTVSRNDGIRLVGSVAAWVDDL